MFKTFLTHFQSRSESQGDFYTEEVNFDREWENVRTIDVWRTEGDYEGSV